MAPERKRKRPPANPDGGRERKRVAKAPKAKLQDLPDMPLDIIFEVCIKFFNYAQTDV